VRHFLGRACVGVGASVGMGVRGCVMQPMLTVELAFCGGWLGQSPQRLCPWFPSCRLVFVIGLTAKSLCGARARDVAYLDSIGDFQQRWNVCLYVMGLAGMPYMISPSTAVVQCARADRSGQICGGAMAGASL
jgi:hypothetical protein